MFKKLLSRLFKPSTPAPNEPIGPYLVLSWDAVNNTLGQSQLAMFETLIAQVVGNSPAHTHQNLVVIKVPDDTSKQLINLASASAPSTCH
tara:strand:+ start:758 stop:1027 length:270 start_codon:yes stop_codon:yes gene_type:complete